MPERIVSSRNSLPQSVEQLNVYATNVLEKKPGSIKKFQAKLKALPKKWKTILLGIIATGTVTSATLYFSPTARAKLQSIAKVLKKRPVNQATTPASLDPALKNLVGNNAFQRLNPKRVRTTKYTKDIRSQEAYYQNQLKTAQREIKSLEGDLSVLDKRETKSLQEQVKLLNIIKNLQKQLSERKLNATL
jgi:hypothetical protein